MGAPQFPPTQLPTSCSAAVLHTVNLPTSTLFINISVLLDCDPKLTILRSPIFVYFFDDSEVPEVKSIAF